MLKNFLIIISLLFSLKNVAQKGNLIEYNKKQFFLLQNKPDSALIYVNKLFVSKKPIDLAFAYTTKKYILTVTGEDFDEVEYDTKIKKNLDKTENIKSNYTDLGNIYNILGHIEKNNDRLDSSLKNYSKAKEYALKNNDSFQLAKIKISIAINLSSLNLLDKAIIESKEVNQLLKKIELNSDNYNLIKKYNINTLGLAFFKKYNEKPNENEKYSDSSIIEFNKIISESNDKIYLAQASYYLGLLYSSKNDFEEANKFLLSSKNLYEELNIKKFSLNAEFNYYYNNYKKGDFKIAKKGFLKFIRNENDSTIDFNYLYSHKYLSKIYIKENVNDSIEHFYDKFLFLSNKITEKEKKEFAEAYKTLENTELKTKINSIKQENHNLKVDKKIILIILFITILIAFLLFRNLKLKKKRQEIKFQEIIKNYNKTEIDNKSSSKEKKNSITDELELKIIEGLNKIENKKYFLDKNFNLYNAAKKINTNTSYLSNFINKNNNTSFNDYTNNLRINYIVKMLIEEKKTRNYTTQALAEIVGYKNGASFSRIFKEKTGVTPILFINKLKSN